LVVPQLPVVVAKGAKVVKAVEEVELEMVLWKT
jgi:hypothetical protein